MSSPDNIDSNKFTLEHLRKRVLKASHFLAFSNGSERVHSDGSACTSAALVNCVLVRYSSKGEEPVSTHANSTTSSAVRRTPQPTAQHLATTNVRASLPQQTHVRGKKRNKQSLVGGLGTYRRWPADAQSY